MKKRLNTIVGFPPLNPSSIEVDYKTVNAVFDSSPVIEVRPSFEQIITASGTQTNSCKYENRILHSTSGTLYQDGVSLLSGMQASEWCDFTEANELLFIAPSFEAEELIRVYDGATLRVSDAKVSETMGLQAGIICNYKGVLFAAKIKEVDGLHANRIRWSAFGEPENFSPWGQDNYQNYEDIGDADDPIVRLYPYQNNLIVFKQKSIWLVSGISGVNGFTGPEMIREINHEFGLVGPNALTADESKLMFVGDPGFWCLSGEYFKQLDTMIYHHLKALPRQLWRTVSVSHDHRTSRTFVLLPSFGDVNENCYVCTQDKYWSRWQFSSPMRLITVIDNEIYLGGEGGNIYKEGGTETRTAVIDSGWINLGYDGVKLLRSAEMRIGVAGDFDMTLETFYDFSNMAFQTLQFKQNDFYPVLDSSNLDMTSATSDKEYVIPVFKDLQGQCKQIRFRITGTFLKFFQLKIGFIKGTGI